MVIERKGDTFTEVSRFNRMCIQTPVVIVLWYPAKRIQFYHNRPHWPETPMDFHSGIRNFSTWTGLSNLVRKSEINPVLIYEISDEHYLGTKSRDLHPHRFRALFHQPLPKDKDGCRTRGRRNSAWSNFIRWGRGVQDQNQIHHQKWCFLAYRRVLRTNFSHQ